ncbi:GTPase family protein [Edwardsiella tarda]|uniref:GTPase family protein n=1 Tax=Edwardsiella tarda TaxID=636 RepID=UPI000D50A52B|nr:GTPase [Edwardsiella tarda]UCQ12824.1 50S ribosome-binding GTPase [Edwardsiella tarda]
MSSINEKIKEFNGIITYFNENVSIVQSSEATCLCVDKTLGLLSELRDGLVLEYTNHTLPPLSQKESNLLKSLYEKISIAEEKIASHKDDGIFGFIPNSELRKAIVDGILRLKNYNPRIGVMGKTGSGKSSLCNAIFGSKACPTSDVEACTRNIKELKITHGKNTLTLVDLPGVGESYDRDKEYFKLYAEEIPKLDLILWVIKADDRALSPDESFYQNVIKQMKCEEIVMFVINQADKIEPTVPGWNIKSNTPSKEQFISLNKKIDDIRSRLFIPKFDIVSVCCNARKYNIDMLVNAMIRNLPNDKRSSIFRFVEKDNRTEQSENDSKNGFVEVVEDIFDVAIDIIPMPAPVKTIVKKLKTKIIDGARGLWDRMFNR